MAIPDGAAVAEKSLWQAARVTNVITPNQFQAGRLAEYGDEYFAFWTVYVLRDIRSVPGAVAAPQGEQEIITAFTSQGGTVTHPAFTVPMIAGDEILMIHPNIGAGIGAAIVAVLATLGPAATSVLGNIYNILGNPAVSLSASLAAILAAIGAGTGTSQGLFYYGLVTGAAAPSFTIGALAGLGDGKFADPVAPYWAFLMRRALGAVAPQGEQQAITAYVAVGGVFTAGAFTAPGIAVGDEVLVIHPRLAEIASRAVPGDAMALTAAAVIAIRQSVCLPGDPASSIGKLLNDYLNASVAAVKTQTDKLPSFEHEVEWTSTPVAELVADAAATPLTAGAITPTFPASSTRVRAILVASIHAANQSAATHHIGFEIEGLKTPPGGAYADLLVLTAVPPLALVNLDGTGDGWCGAIDVTALVDTSAVLYNFRFVVDSDNAGGVNYTTGFTLVLVYNIP